ncbi:hypothetical protein TNCV_5047471 [Trichonephila clavipes]|nr:hypothetical protein TNCV_5047471 [Trichonephila clavipes]
MHSLELCAFEKFILISSSLGGGGAGYPQRELVSDSIDVSMSEVMVWGGRTPSRAGIGSGEEPLGEYPRMVRGRRLRNPSPLLCERTASANQIAGKWCDCSFGRQIHSVAVPAEFFCPF